MYPLAFGMLYLPLAVWGGTGFALVYSFRRSAPAILLRLAASFVALWAVLATTLLLWVVVHGGWSAAAELVRAPLTLFAPACALFWLEGAAGATLVFAVAFALNQAVGRGFLAMLRPAPLAWPARLPRPGGVTNLFVFEDGQMEAFSFTLLRMRHGGRWRLHREEVILLSRGLLHRLTAGEVEAVVAHELGHVRDLDGRYLTFLRTLSRMMRWDPVLAFVAWRLSLREEYRADDEAVRLTGRPLLLARALYKALLEGPAGTPAPGALLIPAGRRGRREAYRRIERLLALHDAARPEELAVDGP